MWRTLLSLTLVLTFVVNAHALTECELRKENIQGKIDYYTKAEKITNNKLEIINEKITNISPQIKEFQEYSQLLINKLQATRNIACSDNELTLAINTKEVHDIFNKIRKNLSEIKKHVYENLP